MRHLAYFIATGHHNYRVGIQLAILSLRRFGRFTGDIVVFSDVEFSLPGGARLRLLPEELRGRPTLKMRAGALLPLEVYDTVLYADCDILFRGSMAPLLERCVASQRLVCTDDMGSRTREPFFCKCLDAHELARVGQEPGLNAGFFIAPGAKLRKNLRDWTRTLACCTGREGSGIDQPPFNAAVQRGLIPIELVEGMMWFPSHHPNAPDGASGEERLAETAVYARTKATAPLAHFTGLVARPEGLGRMAVEYLKRLVTHPLHLGPPRVPKLPDVAAEAKRRRSGQVEVRAYQAASSAE